MKFTAASSPPLLPATGLGRSGQCTGPRRGPYGDNGRPQPWALYDTGQAVAALVTQAQADGLAVHQMGGFDPAAVRAGFGLDDSLTPVVIVAIGRPDRTAGLPEPLAARERSSRTRRPVSDLLLPAGTTVELAAA